MTKRLGLLLGLLLVAQLAFAQFVPYEVKVKSVNQNTVVGILRVANVEGIGVETVDGTYFTFRPADLLKIKVRKMSEASLAQNVGRGALYGLGAGVGIRVGADNRVAVANTVLNAGAGVLTGVAVTGISSLFNSKLSLNVGTNPIYYQNNFKSLQPYIIEDPTFKRK